MLASAKLGLISFFITAIAFLANNGQQVVWNSRFSGACLIALLVLIGLVGVPFSVWPGNAFTGWRTIIFVNSALYFFWLPAVRHPKNLRAVVIVVVAASCFLVVSMLFIDSAVRYGDVANSRLSVGASYDPNDIAMILVAIFPLTVFLVLHNKAYEKVIFLGILVCQAVAILLTGSRGGLLAFVTMSAMFFLSAKKMMRFRHKIFAIAFIVGLIVYIMSSAGGPIRDRWHSIWSGEDYNLQTADEGQAGRLSKWISGLQLIAKNPLIGVGVDNAGAAMGLETGQWLTVHNSYLQAGLELGLPGFAVFTLLLHTIWRKCTNALRRFEAAQNQIAFVHLAACARISLVCYMVAAFFLSQAYSIIWFILLLIANGLYFQSHTNLAKG